MNMKRSKGENDIVDGWGTSVRQHYFFFFIVSSTRKTGRNNKSGEELGNILGSTI